MWVWWFFVLSGLRGWGKRLRFLRQIPPFTGQMLTLTTTRKDLPIDGDSETVKKWVSRDKDIEAMVVHRLGSYSVLSFMVSPAHSDHESGEDVVFNLDVVTTDSMEQAEREFKSYPNNFL